MDFDKIIKKHNTLLEKKAGEHQKDRFKIYSLISSQRKSKVIWKKFRRLAFVYSLAFLTFTIFNSLLLDAVKPRNTYPGQIIKYREHLNNINNYTLGHMISSLDEVKKWVK